MADIPTIIKTAEERLKPCPEPHCKGKPKIVKDAFGVYAVVCSGYACGLTVDENRFPMKDLSDIEQIALVGEAWNNYVKELDVYE